MLVGEAWIAAGVAGNRNLCYLGVMERTSQTDMAFLSEVAARFGVPRRRLAVAVEAAERLSREEFALLQELLLLQTLGLERRRAMAEGLREAMEQYRTAHSDPLQDVDDPIENREAAVAVFWSDVEARANRARLLRGCVSAEEAGRLTGRSRQAVEKQRRSGRMLALRSGRQWRYPVWQLDADEPGGLVPGVVEVLERLPLSPAGVALWLTTANPELDGETPIQVLRNRQTDRVVSLAEQQGYLP